MDLPGLTATTGPRHPLQRGDEFRHGAKQIGHQAIVGNLEDRCFGVLVAVSYTHLTLPTSDLV